MLFNSIHFMVFFPLVVAAYYLLPFRHRNLLLLITSYYFYGSWNWQYLGLLFISTWIDYTCGLKIDQSHEESVRKFYLRLSFAVNIGLLCTFKYYNFFISNLPYSMPYLNVVMPIGLSFYTFQSMAYSIDVYRKDIPAEKNFFKFALFISFFPQLVAGPIEKAEHLLNQFSRNHLFRDIDWKTSLRLILIGLFKKIVIADRIAPYVDNVFANVAGANSLTLLIGVHFFIIQMYCDFSGYTDIARGVAKILGFNLSINFKQPFIATNLKELLRHWHITLVDWIKNYVYFPLGGNKGSTIKTFRNYTVVMILSGFWHGANWTFIVWGIVIALGFMFLHITPEFKMPKWLKILITMEFWSITGGMFFRANTLGDSWIIFTNIWGPWHLDKMFFVKAMTPISRNIHFSANFAAAVLLVIFMFYIDVKDRKQMISNFHLSLIIFALIFFGVYDEKAFVYFQF